MFFNTGNFFVTQANSYIRIFHASPDAPPVDIYLNNKIAASNLSYRNFTNYTAVVAGTYNVKVYPAGRTANPIIDMNLTIPERSISTIAAINRINDLALYVIPEPQIQTVPGRSYVRAVHLSPNAPPVDVTLADGTKIFSNIQYKEVSNYIPLRPGQYNLQLRAAGTDNVVLQIPNIIFRPNRYLSVYAIGLLNERPPLQVVIPMDGNTYLRV